ncbi:MAG TPA: hypothetical protein VFY78_10145 [Gammaproteobacteria bacterium]|nr:hypothetical protein [Gammaproteobacteria bacterium]
MLIRLYFLVPDADQARKVIDELSDNEIPPSRIHVHSRKPSLLSRLPRATLRQQHDVLRTIEQVLWRADLLLFVLALAAFIATLVAGYYLWMLVSLAVMAISFFGGNFFASHIPNVHLNEFSDALSHSEVLLMVDVEQHQVARIEFLVGQHHPAAVAGGSSWTLDVAGI